VAIVLEMIDRAPMIDDIDVRLWEISEKLIRANLTPAQESAAIDRCKAIYEELHPETKHGGDRKSDQVENISTRSFADATADPIGKTSRSVRTAAARGEALDDIKGDVVGPTLDKGVEMDALAKMQPAVQFYLHHYAPSCTQLQPSRIQGITNAEPHRSGKRYCNAR